MPSAMKLRIVFAAGGLRRLVTNAKGATQRGRLLPVAAALDGMNPTKAAVMGGVDWQSLRDGIHRLNEASRDGPLENWTSGMAARRSAAQQAGVTKFVEIGPDRGVDGIRWPHIDLKRIIAERFGIDYYERRVEMLFKKFCFSYICWRLGHLAQDPETVTGIHFLRKPAPADSSITMVRTFMAKNIRYSKVFAGIQVDASVA